jgi:O-antigen/teichoic acid export membrane protein
LFGWGAALVLLGALAQLQLDFLRARQQLYYFSLIQLTESLATIAAVAFVLPGGYGLIALVQMTALIKLAIVLTVLAGFFTWDKPAPGATSTAGPGIGRMVKFGMPLVVSGLGLWMMTLGDRGDGHYLARGARLYGAAARSPA